MEELKFPLEWTKCPVCGSTRRVAETLVKQEQEKGKFGKDAKPFLFMQQTLIMDPRRVTLSVPVVFTFFDICAEPGCGAVYCIHAELGQGSPQMRQPPPGGNMGQFPFPQGNRGLS